MLPSRSTPGMTWVGDHYLRLSFELSPPNAQRAAVRAAFEQVRRASLAGLIDAVPTRASLLLTFDPASLDHEQALNNTARALASSAVDPPASAPRLMEVPVCYQGPCAPDLADVARACALSEQAVIDLHCGAAHTVEFLGFQPGFAYISGLPPALEIPRLATPRARVPAGSIGITGDQTGIYPRATPGGWRLIGRTPFVTFDPCREPPSLLGIGDRVCFVPIDLAKFEHLIGERR